MRHSRKRGLITAGIMMVIAERSFNRTKSLWVWAFLLISIVNLPMMSTAQWVQTSGPGGGVIHDIASDGTRLYAGTYGIGLLRSDDNGASWVAANGNLGRGDVHSIATCGPRVIVGRDSVYHSLDAGLTWSTYRIWAPSAFRVTGFASTSSKLFVNTAAARSFISHDSGNTWIEAAGNWSGVSIGSLAVSETNLFLGGSGVRRSADGGVNWMQVNVGLTNQTVTDLAVIGSTVFAATTSAVFRSTDQGDSWTPVVSGGQFRSLAIIDHFLFASCWGTGIYRSADTGLTWTAVDTNLANHDLSAIVAHGADLLAATWGNGILRSSDHGVTWQDANHGVANSDVQALAVTANTLFAGTYFSGFGVHSSVDLGDHWTIRNEGLTNTAVYALLATYGRLYAGSAGTGGGVAISTDLGLTWMPSNAGLGSSEILALAADSVAIYAGSTAGVYRSIDSGANWTLASTGITNSDVRCLLVHHGYVFAGTRGGGVFRSSDHGLHWVSTGAGGIVYSLAATDSIIVAVGIGAFYRSLDHGATWEPAGSGTSGIPYSAAAVGNTLFVGTEKGVYRRTSSGTGWTSISPEMADVTVQGFAADDSCLYAGTYQTGVWRRPLNQVLPCCVGTTGNVNMEGIVDLADLTSLVSYLTGGGFVPPCTDEANINGVSIIDLTDLSALVGYLTGGGYLLPPCG